jgi:hypothetical protein
MRDAAVFPYGITFTGEGSLKTFPAAKVDFLNNQGEWFTLFLLIDSGASVSVLPKADALLFGIELKAGKPAAVAGVGADQIRGWQHTLRHAFRTLFPGSMRGFRSTLLRPTCADARRTMREAVPWALSSSFAPWAV